MHDIDLLQHRSDSDGTEHRWRNVNRPELRTDAAFFESRKISDQSLGARVPRQVKRVNYISALAELPRQIVVPINQRDLAQNFFYVFNLSRVERLLRPFFVSPSNCKCGG